MDNDSLYHNLLAAIVDAHEQNDAGRPESVTTALATMEELLMAWYHDESDDDDLAAWGGPIEK
jgi:hypothetical protein